MDEFVRSINEAANMDSSVNEAGSPRRSGRSRKANTKYASTGWTRETLRALRESSESSNPTSVDTNEESADQDESFEEQELAVADLQASEDEDNLSVQSRSSQSSKIATARNGDSEDDLDNDDGGVNDDGDDVIKRARWKQPAHLHSRGLVTIERGRSVKGGAWQAALGPNLEDLLPMLKAKEQWLYRKRDVTLPSRETSRACRNEWTSDEESSSTQLMNSEIPLKTKERQRLDQIPMAEAKKRLFLINGPDHKIILGPWSQQQSYDLPFLGSVSLGQAWKKSDDEMSSSYHSGWLLNVGEKPRCMAWSPHQAGEQYLALVCRSTPEQRRSVPVVEIKASPAFSLSPGYPLSIQIWKFAIASHSTDQSSLDLVRHPRLIQLIGLNFGDVQEMAWVPESKHAARIRAQTHLGVLTLLTTDGCVRLIHVPNYDFRDSTPSYLRVTLPFLQFDPTEGSIFTCFTFASATDLILGTSLGQIKIYNISQPIELGTVVQPYLSLQLDSTYLMSLNVADGEYSHFLVSSSAAGDIQLTDLRSPVQDQVHVSKSRIPTRNMVYNSHSRSFIMTIDSTGNTEQRGNAQTSVIAHTLRYFFSAMLIAKYPEGGGTATALGGSPLHPFILMGNSSGTVWTQNVLRRILPTGKPGGRTDGGAWVQKVLEYEWIPQPPSSTKRPMDDSPLNADQKPTDFYNGPPVRAGVSRMHHGFVPEKLDLSNTGSKKRKVPASSLEGDSAVLVTFEEEQAVTTIEWNVNPIAATWCAIGWGSGVVLVTDLGHEAT